MPLFAPPKVKEFFDDRLIISWLITQPHQYPELTTELVIQISTDPSVIFEPLQDQKVTILNLSDNDFIVNWVIKKPIIQTEILLKILNQEISEEHSIRINPDDFI